jgi:hypothetical protein
MRVRMRRWAPDWDRREAVGVGDLVLLTIGCYTSNLAQFAQFAKSTTSKIYR